MGWQCRLFNTSKRIHFMLYFLTIKANITLNMIDLCESHTNALWYHEKLLPVLLSQWYRNLSFHTLIWFRGFNLKKTVALHDSQYIFEYSFYTIRRTIVKPLISNYREGIWQNSWVFFPWNSISICEIENLGKWQKRQMHIAE